MPVEMAVGRVAAVLVHGPDHQEPEFIAHWLPRLSMAEAVEERLQLLGLSAAAGKEREAYAKPGRHRLHGEDLVAPRPENRAQGLPGFDVDGVHSALAALHLESGRVLAVGGDH